MDKPYLTLKQDGVIEIVIKKSQFICNIKRTETEEEARAFIEEIKTKHRKATHNCFAYTLGLNDEIQRESDNGEHSGTAGVPMLDVLKKNQVHNVCAVVTRYFGGIKLGTGGLIRAYGGAVAQALKELGIVKRVVHVLNAVQSGLDHRNAVFRPEPIQIIQRIGHGQFMDIGGDNGAGSADAEGLIHLLLVHVH